MCMPHRVVVEIIGDGGELDSVCQIVKNSKK